MCTVSYLPLDRGYILTSNRDETPQRRVSTITSQARNGQTIHFPKDPQAGGSWFALSDHGYVACLLNGAYEPFEMTSQYTLSRGTVLLDSFNYRRVDDFVTNYAFGSSAPFTLLLIRNGQIHELVWDGQSIRHTILDPGVPHFWSSVTLYPPDVRSWRNKLFEDWLTEHPQFDQSAIVDFHKYGGKGDEANDFVMNRSEKVKTLSISSVLVRDEKIAFSHTDLDDDTRSRSMDVDVKHNLELTP